MWNSEGWVCQLNSLSGHNQLDMISVNLPEIGNEFTDKLLFIIPQWLLNIDRLVLFMSSFHSSVSIFSSAEGICLGSDSESLLGFADPASTRPSDDKFNEVVPDVDPNNRRTGLSAEDDAARL